MQKVTGKPHAGGRVRPQVAGSANGTTLSSKGQISIPKGVRDEQDWKAGQKFVFIPKGMGVILVPVPTLDELRGIAEGASTENYRDRDDRY